METLAPTQVSRDGFTRVGTTGSGAIEGWGAGLAELGINCSEESGKSESQTSNCWDLKRAVSVVPCM